MGLNNNGQAILFTIMLGVVILILAVALAPVLNTFTAGTMNETYNGNPGLNCTNGGTIINGTNNPGDIEFNIFGQSTCTILDLYLPFFIGSLVAIGGAAIGAKLFFSTA
jgi:hypothetical protein